MVGLVSKYLVPFLAGLITLAGVGLLYAALRLNHVQSELARTKTQLAAVQAQRAADLRAQEALSKARKRVQKATETRQATLASAVEQSPAWASAEVPAEIASAVR